MKLVLPVGRDKMVTAAEFDVEPRFGCACFAIPSFLIYPDYTTLPPGEK